MNGCVNEAPSEILSAGIVDHRSTLQTAPKHFEFVDALRGFAILGVMLVHASMSVPDFHGRLRGIASQGMYGVQLFFVVSAFTLFWSLRSRTRAERAPLAAFYTRRICRIGPLFWVAAAFYVYDYGLMRHPLSALTVEYLSTRAPNGIHWPHVFLTAIFMHGWYPTTINSVVPGGWSIAAEFSFYLTIPFLFSRIRTLSAALWLTLISATLAGLVEGPVITHLSHHFPAAWDFVIKDFVQANFLNQFPVFCLGMVLYFLLLPQLAVHTDRAILPNKRSMALLLIVLGTFLVFGVAPRHILVSVAFVAVAFGLSMQPFPLLVNPVMRFIGTISFSAYIWHFWVLDHMMTFVLRHVHAQHLSKDLVSLVQFMAIYLGTAIGVLPVATASYFLIEVPGQNVGKWIIRRFGWGANARPTTDDTMPAIATTFIAG